MNIVMHFCFCAPLKKKGSYFKLGVFNCCVFTHKKVLCIYCVHVFSSKPLLLRRDTGKVRTGWVV